MTSNLLFHHGVEISEAMAFGVGAGIFFGYFPFIKIGGLPLTTYRNEAGGVFKGLTKKLRVGISWEKFRDPVKAMAALDQKLAEGVPVGLRTGAYWLPYFPSAFRFHFNAHNLVVIGKNNGTYLVSDPVFPEPETCSAHDLLKARFAKGVMAPKGTMYYLTKVPERIDLTDPIKKGIKAVCKRMLKAPVPLIGVKGILLLAKQVEKWPKKFGKQQASLYVGQVIRMQEEIGTGGAGFRFMYAAFLQEAAGILGENRLLEISQRMTATGDRWRKFAVVGSRICKNRASESETYGELADILRGCANREKEIFNNLWALV